MTKLALEILRRVNGYNDGISECYCFDGTSFMYASTTTPDGYTVDENGAWTVDGVVQTKNAEAQATETQFTEQISSEVPDVAGTYAGSGIICIIANEGNNKFWVECDLGKDYLPSYAGNGVFARLGPAQQVVDGRFIRWRYISACEAVG